MFRRTTNAAEILGSFDPASVIERVDRRQKIDFDAVEAERLRSVRRFVFGEMTGRRTVPVISGASVSRKESTSMTIGTCEVGNLTCDDDGCICDATIWPPYVIVDVRPDAYDADAVGIMVVDSRYLPYATA